MEDSILVSIKSLLGLGTEDSPFDLDVMIHINTAFMRLTQLAVGPALGFKITGKEAKWQDFTGGREDLEGVKTYVYQKVRLVFDPPQTSFLLEAVKANITELEWQLNNIAEGGIPSGV